MRLGVTFPQLSSGTDPVALRDFVQAVEGIGYDHLLIYDHVLGADPASRPGWTGNYTHESLFHEPLVFLGYVAALTTRLELVTGVVVLPQRQTALVAKQAAEVDVLSGGRLRLGVGVGWNQIEFDALNANFGNRGARLEEQIDVLRALWTTPVVQFKGKWHDIDAAGINPPPVQRPIPIWLGGWDERVLRRVGRLADGWFPLRHPADGWEPTIERVRRYAAEAGRDPNAIGIEPRFTLRGSPDDWRRAADDWRARGATHYSVHTMESGFTHLDDHIKAIRDWFVAVK